MSLPLHWTWGWRECPVSPICFYTYTLWMRYWIGIVAADLHGLPLSLWNLSPPSRLQQRQGIPFCLMSEDFMREETLILLPGTELLQHSVKGGLKILAAYPLWCPIALGWVLGEGAWFSWPQTPRVEFLSHWTWYRDGHGSKSYLKCYKKYYCCSITI